MGLDERSTMRIEVKGKKAKVLNDAKQPVLVVNDLKLDEGAAGGVGFWVDNGTEGYFTDLEVRAE